MTKCEKTYQVEYGTEEPCELKNTECVIHLDPITYLGVPANTSQKEINHLLVLALQALEQRVTQLENI